MSKEVSNCPEFPFFGAMYPDARCIDGYLWDLDSYEDGSLTIGGCSPCPFCNTEEFIDEYVDLGFTREYVLKWIEDMKYKY